MERIEIDLQTGQQKIVQFTQEEIDASKLQAQQAADFEAQQKIINADQLRKYAYQTEADPLFFKAQRGESKMQDWLDKVAEIKARFPKTQN